MWSQVRLLPYSLLYLLLSSAGITVNVEPRSLSELTDEELTSLASTPPAAKHLDPYDPNSHLFKILIPRARRLPEFLGIVLLIYLEKQQRRITPSSVHISSTH